MLVVLYDDTGPAAWSPFGGRTEMPTRSTTSSASCAPTSRHRKGPPGTHQVRMEFAYDDGGLGRAVT
jgi:hypothetical protein